MNGARSSSPFRPLASLYDSVSKVVTRTSTLSQTPTSTEISLTSEYPIVTNGKLIFSRVPRSGFVDWCVKYCRHSGGVVDFSFEHPLDTRLHKSPIGISTNHHTPGIARRHCGASRNYTARALSIYYLTLPTSQSKLLTIFCIRHTQMCRTQSTDHDLEGGIRVTVGQNKLQHIRLPAVPMSPITKDF